MKIPFIIYADIESLLKKYIDVTIVQKSHQHQK